MDRKRQNLLYQQRTYSRPNDGESLLGDCFSSSATDWVNWLFVDIVVVVVVE